MTKLIDPRSELLGIAERLRHLHAEHLRAAHDSAAFAIAQNYLANLDKDTANTLGTLAGLINAFRVDVGGKVRSLRSKFRQDSDRI